MEDSRDQQSFLQEMVGKALDSIDQASLNNNKRMSIIAEGEESAVKKAKSQSVANEYVGWTVPSAYYQIPTINVTEVTPESFYRDYIRLRKPVVLRGQPEDLKSLSKWSNNSYLKSTVGNETLQIEAREDTKGSYGKGNEVPMKFSEFLHKLEDGNELYYLTTQNVLASSSSGRPDLMAPFMKKLSQDFPTRPELMGNLVPQNVNIWMGNGKKGSSSGLHHDYHDNLYIVLRGKKQFRLYSPADAQHMVTRGILQKVHQNGRINYVGEATTADGADLQAEAAADAEHAKEVAEVAVANAEAAVARGESGAQEKLDAAEEMLDNAMEALLDAEFSDGGCEVSSEDSEPEEEMDCSSSINNNRVVDKTVKDPINFCLVPPALLNDKVKLALEYPSVANANQATASVCAGEMLYLPASWFHEVVSINDSSETSKEAGGHFAMNYWFHPPDATNNFAAPYTKEFWPRDFKARHQ